MADQQVDFILDLVGYRSDRPLLKLKLLEPSFGDGDFLLPAIDRLLRSWKTADQACPPLEGVTFDAPQFSAPTRARRNAARRV